MIIEVGAFACSVMIAGKLGAVILSAHQIVLHIASFTFMIPMGISTAAAVQVGHAVGERKPGVVALRGWSAFALGLMVMAVISLILFCFRHVVIALFTNNLDVQNVANLLIYIVVFFQVFDGAQVIASGVMRGIGNTKVTMVTDFHRALADWLANRLHACL